jgi:type II secretory pathway component GspD/PulD (secretin)
MFMRATSPAMRLFPCGLVVMTASVCCAADPPKPGSSKPPEVDQARVEVLRALEQFREAETRLRQAEKRLRDLDGKPAPAADEAQAETKVFSLRYTDADALAKMLGEMFGKGRVAIAVDPRLNALIIRGKPLDLMEVEALLGRLDQEGKPAVVPPDEFSVIRLKNAEAQAIAAVLTQMYGKGKDSRAMIVVEPLTNSLLVRARDEDRKAIEALIRFIDQESKAASPAPEPQPDVTVLRLDKADAAEMSKVLTELFGKGRAQIVADPATQSLLVRARAEDLKQIAVLVKQLDVPPAKPR